MPKTRFEAMALELKEESVNPKDLVVFPNKINEKGKAFVDAWAKEDTKYYNYNHCLTEEMLSKGHKMYGNTYQGLHRITYEVPNGRKAVVLSKAPFAFGSNNENVPWVDGNFRFVYKNVVNLALKALEQHQNMIENNQLEAIQDNRSRILAIGEEIKCEDKIIESDPLDIDRFKFLEID